MAARSSPFRPQVPVLGYPSRTAAVRALAEAGHSLGEIAHRMEMTPTELQRQCSAARVLDRVPQPEPQTLAAPRDPCFRCGTRADLGCKHQKAVYS